MPRPPACVGTYVYNQATAQVEPWMAREYATATLSDESIGLRNADQTALVVTLTAMEARESRGCHYRID